MGHGRAKKDGETINRSDPSTWIQEIFWTFNKKIHRYALKIHCPVSACLGRGRIKKDKKKKDLSDPLA